MWCGKRPIIPINGSDPRAIFRRGPLAESEGYARRIEFFRYNSLFFRLQSGVLIICRGRVGRQSKQCPPQGEHSINGRADQPLYPCQRIP
jgi:hypothetical protein